MFSHFCHWLLADLRLKELQSFLNAKAEKLSRSVVAHLRWDLRSIYRLAVAEGYADRDPTAALFTPKDAASSPASLTLSKEEVEHYIKSLEQRERAIALLAIFAGMRPGEILALQRRHVSGDCRKARVEQRIYRGDIDTPKTTSSTRTVAIPPQTAERLKEWMELVAEHLRNLDDHFVGEYQSVAPLENFMEQSSGSRPAPVMRPYQDGRVRDNLHSTGR